MSSCSCVGFPARSIARISHRASTTANPRPVAVLGPLSRSGASAGKRQRCAPTRARPVRPPPARASAP
eukprot:11997226-Alexandrium_andersonii.AAC.1